MMNRSEINEYNQGYRHALVWLGKQHSLTEVRCVMARLRSHEVDHGHDLWERGHYNALSDWVSRHEVITH